MKIFKKIIALAACLPLIFSAAACAGTPATKDEPDPVKGHSTALGNARTPQPLGYYDRTEGFYTLRDAAVSFAGDFTGAAYELFGDSDKNMAVSPISLYLALGITAAIAEGSTKTEVLSALGVSESQLADGFDPLCRSVSGEWRSNVGDLEGRIDLSNSVWVADGTSVKQGKINELANTYYCSSYSADFKNNNAEANAAVRKYIKEKTNGLIDKDFGLARQTVFALINALYLKDIWNDYGDDIFTTDQKYEFRSAGGIRKTRLMCSEYIGGRAKDLGDFTSFHTYTLNGVEISFMLPKQGSGNVFTAENFKKLATAQYTVRDDQKKEEYYTRCLFPQFSADFDSDVKDILKDKFGINELFKSTCDLTGLTDERAYCSNVQHVTDLTVDKKGIEGAAVTVEVMSGTAAPGDYDYKKVYEDFLVDGAFGFCISYNGVPLFTGVANDIKVI